MSQQMPAPPTGNPPRTILVVDDEVLIRMPLAEYLRSCGYRVVEAASVAEARTLLDADAAVDLVFTDANAPGGENGFILANWVRHRRPGVKVLLTSGIPHAAAKASELCGDLLTKPYEHESVLRRIQTLLHHATMTAGG